MSFHFLLNYSFKFMITIFGVLNFALLLVIFNYLQFYYVNIFVKYAA